MKNLILSLACILFSFTYSFSQTLESAIESIYEDYQLMGISIWAAVDDDSRTIHFGKRDLDRDLDINDNTKYRIASISKTFSALGLLKLHSQGLFSLDDDISDAMGYSIRNPNYPNQPITYRMLLSHQSTLIDGNGYYNFLNGTFDDSTIPNISELLLPSGSYYTSNMWQNINPGTYFSYSNVNYGLIGTLIEKLSGLRFDVYMKNEILLPLNITGSYNVQDLPNINDVAVLYRHNSVWQPQIDNYQGEFPAPTDLSSYQIGTNGLVFGPQGGLRASALELGKLLDLISGLQDNSTIDISESVINEMNTPQWIYNGSNGNNYFGLFNSWGLGLHVANNEANDMVCGLNNYESFIGHPGEAYGLVSDAFYETENKVRFAMLINGSQNGYDVGTSAFYTVEEAVFEALCNHFNSTLTLSDYNKSDFVIYPNPTTEVLNIKLKDIESVVTAKIINVSGKLLKTNKFFDKKSVDIDVKDLQSGIYFAKIITSAHQETIKFIVR